MSHSSKIHRAIEASILEDDIMDLRETIGEIMNIDKALDQAHSIWIRLLATDENGNGKCACCGTPLNYSLLVCGHFIKRRHLRFRWSKQNTSPICESCNRLDEENLLVMQNHKIKELGIEAVEKMMSAIHIPYKHSNYDKQTLLKTRRLQCRKLLQDKNFTVNIP